MNILHEYKKEIFDLGKINELSQTNTTALIKDAEELYHKQVEDIVDDIVENQKYKVILLAGPSSSGKTTTSNLICQNLSKHDYDSIVISLDDFFVNRENTPLLPNGDYDYENITALDLPYLSQFISDIFNKGEADMPSFNFVTGQREPNMRKIKLSPTTVLIIEGIHALNPILFMNYTDQMYRIYICVNSDFDLDNKIVIPAQKLRLMRRLIRDYRTRGMSLKQTFDVWKNVLAGEDLYIKPYKNTADYLINSTHAYEPLMYSKTLLKMLKNEPESDLRDTLIAMLEQCEPLSPEYLPKNSLLHEFLG